MTIANSPHADFKNFMEREGIYCTFVTSAQGLTKINPSSFEANKSLYERIFSLSQLNMYGCGHVKKIIFISTFSITIQLEDNNVNSSCVFAQRNIGLWERSLKTHGDDICVKMTNSVQKNLTDRKSSSK